MESGYSKPLPFIHISDAANEAIAYIKARKDHTIEPAKIRWKKFGRVLDGGIEQNKVYTIGGESGSGKSAFANTLETDLIDLNPDKDLVILSFSLEMLSRAQVGRKLSNKLRQTTSQLYSAYEDLSDSLLHRVESEVASIKKYPIYYVDQMSTVQKISDTIDYFQQKYKDKWLIIILDHTLLVDGHDERTTIAELQKLFIRAKKVGRTSIIQISQMNRNMENPERRFNPAGHYPIKSDIASSSDVFRASDVVAVLARPELLGIAEYGPLKLPVKNKVYLHILKQREGELGIIEFDNDLKYNNLIEV